MAFTIKEKVFAKLCGGVQFKVFELTTLAAGANNLSAEALGFSEVLAAAYTENTATTSATATAPAMATTYSGNTVVVTAGATNDTGTLKVWGY